MIRILTDSASDILPAEAEQLGVTVIPLNVTLEDGTVLSYSSTVNKFVPPDYEITEEEKKLQEEGKLNVAYGSDEVEVMTSASVTWEQEDISYCLFTFEESMSAEELLSMAKEVAEQE